MIPQIEKHRSIREFLNKDISSDIIEQILLAASRASTTGNMQLYSIIATTSQEVKESLSPCHFNQPMVKQAPLVLTFCADVRRFSMWCELRDAKPVYDNFAWFINSTIDTLLASQNAALEAEANGLGICYLGTTIYTASKICDVLNLPKGVIPITTIVVGYPTSTPELTSRLPLEAVVHYDTYKDYTPELIEKLWEERESSEETKNLLEANNRSNLAQVFTEDRYKGGDNIAISKSYFDILKKQGFFNQEQ